MISYLSDFFQYFMEKRLEVMARTWEHLWLTGISVMIAIVLGLVLGVFITRQKRWASPIIGLANMIQTIPSIALLGFMIPFLGIGATPAIIALFLYALLPIIRNTYAGISEIDPAVKEAAKGMGMTNWQLLIQVEIPLAMPVIFAGIRTATVINVGVATLCALIAAGGLGEFIFTGISLSDAKLILIGAVPAALLAISIDVLLGLIQQYILKWLKPLVISFAMIFVTFIVVQLWPTSHQASLQAGLPAEFMARADGWEGLKESYQLKMEGTQMNAGLMYEAVKNAKVDVIGGYSTDGRIESFDLRVLEDDLHYFPPYQVAPLVRQETLLKYPELEKVLNKLANAISDAEMRKLNFMTDQGNQTPKEVAKYFLDSLGLNTNRVRTTGDADIVIGGKNFGEQFILAEIFTYLIENYTSLNVESKLGLGGTTVVFEALRAGEIDLYPEYSGTGFLVLLKPNQATIDQLIRNRTALFDYVNQQFQEKFKFKWLAPLGFNNTYALMMREQQAEQLQIQSISELAKYMREK